MPDDWSWFWAGEGGRDRLLREEIEGLQATASASSAHSARLSSQLRTLQGSMESRLTALSTAFDAYVELGDVREQLAGYPDTSAVRREALRVLDVLAQGGVPEPVDPREVDYWLVGAANEVVALAAGTAGPTPTGSGSAGPEHEMFVVAALGWLGRGELVAARVAPLLVADGALAAPQVVLWRAVVHGLFGNAVEAVVSVWERELDLSAPVWETFARDAAGDVHPVAVLECVRDLVEGRPVLAAVPDRKQQGTASAPDDRTALRNLLDALVGAGLGDERALLERARVLRARIEDPGTPEPDPRTEPPRTATTVLVQEALLDPSVGPEAQRALVARVRPGLEAAATAVATRVAAERPKPTTARTPLGDIEVGTEGADPARLAQLDTLAAQHRSTPRARLVVPGVAAGVALVVGLVLLGTGTGGLGVFLLLVAVVAAGLLVRTLLRVREQRDDLADVRQRTRERVEAARAQAVALRAQTLETQTQVAGLARSITGTGVAAGPRLR